MAAVKHDHGAVLTRVQHDLPTDELLCDLGDLFRLFGDTTRIKILYALQESELCVCAIAELLHMTRPAISHQRKVRKDGNLAGNRREGKTIICFLADEHVHSIIAHGFDHLMEEEVKHK